MNASFIHIIKKKAASISWPLLIFMLLVLNVKLVIKLVAVLLIVVLNRKDISVKGFFKQRFLFFYFGMVIIGFINLALHFKSNTSAAVLTTLVAVAFWVLSAVITYNTFLLVQKEAAAKLHNTITAFFILHIIFIVINFISIVIETGVINPYTYKGLNQKYYISTGDAITGVTLDAPVTTAFITVFAVLYFLYRKKILLSLTAMACLLMLASNFANLILLAVFVFIFIFYSSRIQKSVLVIFIAMLVVFMVKISPQNNEHVGRVFYSVIDKPYDLPKEKVFTLDELKKQPDSILSIEERQKKHAQNYIDSMNSLGVITKAAMPAIIVPVIDPDSIAVKSNTVFYQFRETEFVKDKMSRYGIFLNQVFSARELDSLKKQYNWKSPGKWTAAKQLVSFLKEHPSKIITGDGMGNFSSRLAFKATLLNMAGQYPSALKYISQDFLYNHLFLYLHYHSQEQSKHEASNTPDAVYFQVAGEYGVAGLLLLGVYFGFFIRRIHKKSFALPLLFILAGAFFAEFWFEQFSIVVLFELLLFTDQKDGRREEPQL